MLVQRRTPEDAYAPFATNTPPFYPYRDAGYGAATYHITVLDCLRGIYKALVIGLLDLQNLDLPEYEFYEKVENGDFNWITKKFLALASPKDDAPMQSMINQQQQHQQQQNVSSFAGAASGLFGVTNGLSVSNLFYGTGQAYGISGILEQQQQQQAQKQQLLKQEAQKSAKKLFSCYTIDNLIKYMLQNNIKTIIRLNNKTYDKRKFVEAGIDHIELYFPDGTTPPDGILKKFLEICESKEGTKIYTLFYMKVNNGRNNI